MSFNFYIRIEYLKKKKGFKKILKNEESDNPNLSLILFLLFTFAECLFKKIRLKKK